MKINYIDSYYKRILDLSIAIPMSLFVLPLIAFPLLYVYIVDFNSPIYFSQRVGRFGKVFTLFKIRTMQINADKSGTFTTIDGDNRLIPAGNLLRRLKLDELPQFFNIVMNDISLVGPRPNVLFEVARYHNWELHLLKFKPGITDLSSIIFFNLGALIPKDVDPNISYEVFIRPWKNKFAKWYCLNASFSTDVLIIFLTASAFVSKKWTIDKIIKMIELINYDEELITYLKNLNHHS